MSTEKPMSIREYSVLRNNWEGFWTERFDGDSFRVYHKGNVVRSRNITLAKSILRGKAKIQLEALKQEALLAGF